MLEYMLERVKLPYRVHEPLGKVNEPHPIALYIFSPTTPDVRRAQTDSVVEGPAIQFHIETRE
jgi:hypothetical protein